MKKLCLVKKNNSTVPVPIDVSPSPVGLMSTGINPNLSSITSINAMTSTKAMTSSSKGQIIFKSKKILPITKEKKKGPSDYLPHPVEYYSWCPDETYTDSNNDTWVLPHSKKFPQWIFNKYEKYKLPEIVHPNVVTNSDKISDSTILSTKTFLYQDFIAEYINPYTPYRSILLDHGLGSGKSKSSIKVAETFREAGYDIICLLPASLINNYVDEIKVWGNNDLKRPENYESLSYLEKTSVNKALTDKIKKVYKFVSYNSNVTHKKIAELKLKNALIIIDEVHNFANLLCSKTSKYAKSMYNKLMTAENCRFVALSGSPILNGPFSLALFFNILKGYMTDNSTKQRYTLFPEDEDDFNELFIDKSTNTMKNTNLFVTRISGIVSNYEYKQDGLYPDIIHHKPMFLEMSEYQFSKYCEVRAKEKKIEANAIKFGRINNNQSDETKSYRSQSRQYCNFTFPKDIDRPKTLSAKSKELTNISTLNKESRSWKPAQIKFLRKLLANDTRYNKFVYQFRLLKSTKEQILLLISLLKEKNMLHSPDRNIILSDIEIEWAINPNFYDDAIKKALDQLSLKPDELRNDMLKILSCKMHAIIECMENGKGSEGLKFVYSCFRSLEGVEIFSRILQAHGYELLKEYNIDKLEAIGEKKRYAIVSGDEEPDVRSSIISVMTHANNMYGKYCMVLLGTSATAEGISLKYMRQVYIMEPWWNDIKIDQVNGRCCRLGSHLLMPPEEKNVHVYRFMTTLTHEQQIIIGEKYTTDEYIYKIAQNKKHLCEQFLQQIRNGAVDSMLNYNHNSKTNDNIKPLFYYINDIVNEFDEDYMFIPDIYKHIKKNNNTTNDNNNQSIIKIVDIDNMTIQPDIITTSKQINSINNINMSPVTITNNTYDTDDNDDKDTKYAYKSTLYTDFDPGIEYESTSGTNCKLYNVHTKEPVYIYIVDPTTKSPLISRIHIRGEFLTKCGMVLYDRSIHKITNKFVPAYVFIPEDGYGFIPYQSVNVY